MNLDHSGAVFAPACTSSDFIWVSTKGYLCIQSDEAGTLLSRAAAEGKATNTSVHLDWRHWLNTAYGDQFSHSKQWLRNDLQRKKVFNPADRSETREAGVCMDPTNVHMFFSARNTLGYFLYPEFAM